MAMGLADGDARAFLRKALQPPTAAALDAASLALRRVGALVGGDGGAAPPPPPPQKLDRKAEEKLLKWVAAKKARDYATADKIRYEQGDVGTWNMEVPHMPPHAAPLMRPLACLDSAPRLQPAPPPLRRFELKTTGVDVEAAARERVAREQAAADAASGKAAADAAAAAEAAAAAAALPAPREELTPLGLHLAKMPLDARIGKILIYGALLGCYEPALTLAAAMSLARPPFLTPMDRRQEAHAARAGFCKERSDHVALLRAYEGWAAEHAAGGGGAARRYAERHFLSANGMEELRGLRRTLGASLADIGFANLHMEPPTPEAAEGHTNIVRALLCAGLYPNVARIRMPDQKYIATAQGAIEAVNDDARSVKFYELGGGRTNGVANPGGGRVFMHPSCVLFGESAFEHARWLVFSSKQRVGGEPGGAPSQPPHAAGHLDGKTYVRDVTAVSPLALLLFGGDVEVHHDKSTVTIDGEITFEAPGRVAVLVRELRTSLDKLLREKIASPAIDIASHPVVGAIVNLLATERAGFS